jgi:hypothetical protein
MIGYKTTLGLLTMRVVAHAFKGTCLRKALASWVLVTHACNPSYWGGSWFEAKLGISVGVPISKITRAKKWTGGVAQAIKHLLCAKPVQSPVPTKKEKNRKALTGQFIYDLT